MSTNDFETIATAPAADATTGPVEQDALLADAPKRFTKRSWITLGVSAGVLLVAAAIAVPVIASNIARGNAIDALAASESALADAHSSLTTAQQELVESTGGAVVIYDESGQFVKVVRADLLADGATLEALNTARAELVEVAGLAVEGDVASAPAADDVPALAAPATPTTVEAMTEQTAANDKLAATYEKEADATLDLSADIIGQGESIAELTETVVESGAAFGVAVTGVEKAAADSTQALAVAVTALADTETPAIGRFSTYVAAYDAVKKSHDDTVAAEQAAAEEAARQEQLRSSGGSSNGSGARGGSSGGSSGGSTGGSGGSGGSTGGSNSGGSSGGSTGGGTGGSTGGGSTGGGGSAPSQVPAKFQTNGNYVPIGQCDGAFHSSHQVGWGGTSTSGGSLQGKWSATVNGDTVSYYLCF